MKLVEVWALLKDGRGISYPAFGYLFLLLGFVSLGVFVATLAFGSDLAVAAGLALAATLVASVMCFRAGARRIAKSRAAGDPGHNKTIWSEPMHGDEVDQYLVTYRGAQASAEQQPAIAERGRSAPVRHAPRPRSQKTLVGA